MPLPAPPACTSNCTLGLIFWYSSAHSDIKGKRANAPDTEMATFSPLAPAAELCCAAGRCLYPSVLPGRRLLPDADDQEQVRATAAKRWLCMKGSLLN